MRISPATMSAGYAELEISSMRKELKTNCDEIV